MVEDTVRFLDPDRGGLFLDGTLGGGGHTEAILTAGPIAQVVGVDQDPEALQEAAQRLAGFGERVRLVQSNFADAATAAGVQPSTLAGALLDLGVSSHQIDRVERGFTFRAGAPLDMRMQGATGEGTTAADLLNEWEEDDLSRLFRRYGEEPRSRKLARLVVERRAERPLATSDDLLGVVASALGPRHGPQDRARIFQALRIVVNREMDVLEAALPQLRDALRPGGVFVVIAYHSLEDRIVKDAFREWSRACICPPALPICCCRGAPLGETLTRKPLVPAPQETERNPRARSAKLRAWRRR